MNDMKEPYVGIITLYGYSNYGNRLQNYALQQVLCELGCRVETVQYHSSYGGSFSDQLRSIYRLPLKENMMRILRKLSSLSNTKKQAKACVSVKELSKLDTVREERFKLFNQKIKTTPFVIEPGNLIPLTKAEYDYYVVGSDQVWSPFTRGSNIEFLTFTSREKRISYAASFGIDELPRRFHYKYRKGLRGMAHLSVREYEGAQIVKRLTGQEVPVHLDPTLLLNVDQWNDLAKKDDFKPSKPYLLTCFLGNINESQYKIICAYAEKYGLEIVSLCDPKDKERYVVGPAQFLDYCQSAAAVVTDSYHVLVFSILFQRPYVVVRRKGETSSGFSRVTTLLKKLELPIRELGKIEVSELWNLDFFGVNSLLQKERQTSIEYLTNALNIYR